MQLAITMTGMATLVSIVELPLEELLTSLATAGTPAVPPRRSSWEGRYMVLVGGSCGGEFCCYGLFEHRLGSCCAREEGKTYLSFRTWICRIWVRCEACGTFLLRKPTHTPTRARATAKGRVIGMNSITVSGKRLPLINAPTSNGTGPGRVITENLNRITGQLVLCQ